METNLYQIENLNEVIEKLENGAVIAFPTDTVFGLGCVFDNQDAINKIKKAKGRDENKPLPMMCSNIEMIKEVAIVNGDALKLLKKFTPGPLTIILNKKEEVPSFITNGFKTIGIRIPNDKMILEMINKLNKPMLVTSANISGKPSLRKYQDVLKELDHKIDGIVCKDAFSDVASTIVDMSDGKMKIIRQGIISFKELKSCL